MKRILIVEDDETLCRQLNDMLIEMGFEAGMCGDGAEALEVLASIDRLPDIILLDLHMPRLNGWQFREELKKEPRYKDIKIVVMSGNTAVSEVEADAHFLKPFELDKLLRVLQ